MPRILEMGPGLCQAAKPFSLDKAGIGEGPVFHGCWPFNKGFLLCFLCGRRKILQTGWGRYSLVEVES